MSQLTPADFAEFRSWYTVRFARKHGHEPAPNTLRSKVQCLCRASRAAGVDSVDSFGRLLSDRDAVITTLDKLLVDLSHGTVKHIVFSLLDFGEWSKAKGLTRYVALERSDAPPENRQGPIVIYTPEEVETLLTAAKGRGLRWWALLCTLADTGRRANEVLSLRWDSYNAEEGYFHLPTSKNGKQQYVPLSRRLREQVYTPENVGRLRNEHMESRMVRSAWDHPFPWSYSAAHARFNRFCRTLGVTNRGFHNFRHTFATNKLSEGVPIHAVASLLGHSSVSTTDRIYNHANALAFREYVE